jgi:opacity protein-like surface antigen
MKNRIRLFLLLAVLAPFGAQAQISWYGGLGVGGSRVEEDLNLSFTAYEWVTEDTGPVLVPIASNSLDKFNGTDLGYRIFAGMRFGKYFGIEGGYVDLADPHDEIPLNIPNSGPSCAPGCRPVVDILLQLEDNIDGWDAYVLGALPITEKLEVFGKLGVIFWESEFKVKNDFADTFPASPPAGPGGVPDGVAYIPTTLPTSFDEKTDGTDLAGAIGVNYKVTDRVTLRGEGTWYDIEDTEQVWLLGINLLITY